MTIATYFQSSFTWEHRGERPIINLYLRLKLMKTISALFQNRIFSFKSRDRRRRSHVHLVALHHRKDLFYQSLMWETDSQTAWVCMCNCKPVSQLPRDAIRPWIIKPICTLTILFSMSNSCNWVCKWGCDSSGGRTGGRNYSFPHACKQICLQINEAKLSAKGFTALGE